MTGPSSGTWSQPGAIPLTATAASNGGSIAQVQFFNGSTLLGTATQSPYSINWNYVSAGTYSITAVATDNFGNTASRSPFSIAIEPTINVSMTNPVNGAHVTGGNFTLTATAAASFGTITQVAFFNGSALMGTVTQPPYSISVPDVLPGVYSITAQATDNLGVTATSAPVTVTVVAGGGAGTSGSDQVYDIHTDQLNTPRMITDKNGNAVWQWDNTDPFGNNLPNQDPNGTGGQMVFNLRNDGQYFDIETGLFYNYFRYYDPTLGAYDQSDLIGLYGGGPSTYAYVGSSPLKYSDPKGLVRWDGNIFNGTISAPFGAAYVEATLYSECVNGQRMTIEVTGAGVAAGAGVKVSATVSDISFEDYSRVLDPNGFNGNFSAVSGAVTAGAVPLRPPFNSRIGPGVPGIGVGVGYVQFGKNFSDALPPGAVVGRDQSVTGAVGTSTVTSVSVTSCTCSKK